MLQHSPSQLARRWDEIAVALTPEFERRVHEFSLPPTADRSGGTSSDTVDPTMSAALSRDDMCRLEDRWLQARNRLAVIAVQVSGKGGVPSRCAGRVAAAVRRGVTPVQAKRLAHLAGEIERLVAVATPLSKTSADFLLGQLEAKTVSTVRRSCDACETPEAHCVRIVSGLCRRCYDAERHLIERGRYVGRSEFIAERVQAITRRDPDVAGKYPFSPYTPEVSA